MSFIGDPVSVATSYTHSLFDEYTFVCKYNMWYEIALIKRVQQSQTCK